jgi:hypothetical protein
VVRSDDTTHAAKDQDLRAPPGELASPPTPLHVMEKGFSARLEQMFGL